MATGSLGGPASPEPGLQGDGASQWPVAPVAPGPRSTRPRPPASQPPDTTPSSPPSAPPPPAEARPDADATALHPPKPAAPISAPTSDEAPATARSRPPSSRGLTARPGVADQAKLPSQPHPRASALTEQTAELERLRKHLSSKDERIKTLIGKVDGLRQRLSDTENRVAAKDEELERLRSQHDSLRALTAVRAERIRELENTHGEQQRRITELELELSERLRAHEASLVALKAEQELAVAQVKAEERAKSVAPPPRDDDLRAIYGIGPKFEKGLHAAGIRRYQQIASWTDEDVETIAAALNVKPKRIRNAGWIESAKALSSERGEPDGDDQAIEGEDSDLAW